MQTWTLVRFLHIAGISFFIGGQLLVAVAVAPVLRKRGEEQAMRMIARRFALASVIALAVAISTGIAMASHFSMWGVHVLQVKLMVLVLVFVLTGLHIASPKSQPVALAVVAASLVVLWLGVKLTYG